MRGERIARGRGEVCDLAVIGGTAAGTAGVVGALGIAEGLSGAGIMSALGTAGGAVGGAAAGPAVLGAMPALASVGVMQLVLRDDESLPEGERAARRDGRVASWVGAGGATAGGVAAISGLGAVGGLSGAGIASGLATIGGVMGGGMAIGATAVVAAPAVAAAALGTGVFLVARRLRNRKHKGRISFRQCSMGPNKRSTVRWLRGNTTYLGS